MPTVDSVRLSPAQRRAVELFHKGACVRTPNEDRLEEGHQKYKKGWEIRFSVRSRSDASELKRILQSLDLRSGRPYRKHQTTWILPMYGREQVQRFLGWAEGADADRFAIRRRRPAE